MVRFTTVIEEKLPKRIIKPVDRFIWALSLVAETGFNTMLPFAFGFYFAKTTNMIFLFFFIMNILFHVRIRRKGKSIEINITRGI